jgi:hypothetical protein
MSGVMYFVVQGIREKVKGEGKRAAGPEWADAPDAPGR